MGSHKSPKRKVYTRRSRGKKNLLLAITFLAILAIAITAFVVFGLNGLGSPANPSSSPSPSPTAQGDSSPTKVLLKTTKGDIVIELRSDMPITTGNFRNLVQQGTYDGTVFHRVIADFMIQGGDPTGTGFGDPSIPNIQDEFTADNRNDRGTIAMANAGPNTGSSQFFINVVNNNYLDTKHPVFGTVIQGMDVVDAISQVATDSNDKPLEDVTIIKAELVS
jgi:peptidylprolyl isomerase